MATNKGSGIPIRISDVEREMDVESARVYSDIQLRKWFSKWILGVVCGLTALAAVKYLVLATFFG